MKETDGGVGEWSDNFLSQKVTEYQELIAGLDGSEIGIEALRTLLCEANGYIALLCGPNLEAYEEYSYHLFDLGDGTFRVIQGIELDTEPGHDDVEGDDD